MHVHFSTHGTKRKKDVKKLGSISFFFKREREREVKMLCVTQVGHFCAPHFKLC